MGVSMSRGHDKYCLDVGVGFDGLQFCIGANIEVLSVVSLGVVAI